jgi:hypothetical protein
LLWRLGVAVAASWLNLAPARRLFVQSPTRWFAFQLRLTIAHLAIDMMRFTFPEMTFSRLGSHVLSGGQAEHNF